MNNKKEVIWAYAFLFFLGGFGVHKFYLGNHFMGFLYMFTFGLCGLGFIYDIFTLPFQVSKANENIVYTKPNRMKPDSCCNCNCNCKN